MKKTYTKLAAVILATSFLGVASPVFASSLYHQYNFSSQSTLQLNAAVQGLGNGLTGVFNDISVRFTQPISTSTSAYAVDIFACSTNSFTVNDCTVPSSGPIFTDFFGVINQSGIYTVSTTTQISFNPTKYYFILIRWTGSDPDQRPYLKGSASNTWSGGSLAATGGGESQSPLEDMFFDIGGTQTVNDTPYTTPTNPENGTTTPSTTVDLSFDYHAPTSYNINNYFIVINDISVSATSTKFTLSGSANSGNNSITRSITLTSGHVYNYVAYICDSNNTCWGGPINSFGVVTGSVNTNYLLRAYEQAGISSTTANDLFGITGLITTIGRKIPFAYFVALINAWDQVTFDATSSIPTLALNFGDENIGSTTPNGSHNPLSGFIPNVTFMSRDVIEKYLSPEILSTFIAIQDVSYFLALGYYFYRRVPGLIRNM